jgi:hypothetical protein
VSIGQVDAGAILAMHPVSYTTRYDSMITRVAARHRIDPLLLHAVIDQESRYRANAVSPVGARGLMQLMPGTARMLNVRTTRMILIEGHAGHIIDTFGTLVAGGNLVVGLVVFLIITVVQFIVIAKGAERVAEVAARFSLDAMPGKQLSIDSDLRSGMIDKDEAKRAGACWRWRASSTAASTAR